MSAHLGPAATALVDGELGHDRREEVLAHLAHCVDCRVEVEVLRTVKASLRAAAPSMPLGLAERLAAAAESCGPGRPDLLRRGAHRRHRPISRRPAAVRRAALGGAAVALGLAGVVVLAGPPPRLPVVRVDPTSSQLLVDHRSTGGEMPFADVGVTTASLR